MELFDELIARLELKKNVFGMNTRINCKLNEWKE